VTKPECDHCFRACLVLEKRDIKWERQPYVSKLLKGTLNVSSKIVKGRIKRNKVDDCSIGEELLKLYKEGQNSAEVTYNSDINCMATEGLHAEVTYALLYTAQSLQKTCFVFLALLPASTNSLMYVRAGCGYLKFNTLWEDLPSSVQWRSRRKDPLDREPDIEDLLLDNWNNASLILC